MPLEHPDVDRLMPYQLENPPDALAEIVVPKAIPDDERLWVPQAENVWFRPLCLNRSQGYWMNLLRVRKSGVLSRHRHPNPVHGFVLKGRWRYLEHDWVA
ncbi:MAG: cupin domain-containing protein, partial [Desulfobacterales bacterium]|nr:cupin domain-containing protein [Desulfobacterales bacterium]